MRPYSWNGCWRMLFLGGLILFIGCSNQTEDLAKRKHVITTAKSHLYGLPKQIIEDSKDTIAKPDNVTLLLLAGGASIAMHQEADKEIADDFKHNEIFHGFTDRSLKLLGGPGPHFAAAGLWFALSASNYDDLNQERAWTMIRALSVTGLTTASLKAVRNNETPAGNDWAWPNGHTSSSFTVAAVLDEFYGPEVGIPAYIAASLVGLRMMDQSDHWASDIVFGATLGYVVGHTVAGKHKELEIAGFKVLPYIGTTGGSSMGISLMKLF